MILQTGSYVSVAFPRLVCLFTTRLIYCNSRSISVRPVVMQTRSDRDEVGVVYGFRNVSPLIDRWSFIKPTCNSLFG